MKNFESSKEAFSRYKEQNDFKKMLKAALNLTKANYPCSKILFELTVICALENN